MLYTWGLNYYLIETDEDVNRIQLHIWNQKKQSTVVCLLGAEYTDQE